jgi:hypothetical protein
MSRLIVGVISVTLAVCAAQTKGNGKEPSDAWLMQNYHLAEPPAPGEIQQLSPAMAQLQEIQNTMLNILRKANVAGDYEAALAAAAQATANAQLIGALSGELRPPTPTPPRGAAVEKPKPEPPIYLIAFKNQTVQVATAVWRDDLMVHYTTRQGGHEQVRLDSVDWKLSTELNRARAVSAP